jgi:hypothetical protein
METYPDCEFKELKRPKIKITATSSSFYDPPILWRFVLTLFWFLLTVLSYLLKSSQREIGIFVILLMTGIFGYGSISLERVRIDLNERVVFRRNLNPIENLIDRIFEHPAKIAFDSISTIYVDRPTWIEPAVNRYCLYLKTTDPYKLRIAVFAKSLEAEKFSRYLTHVIKNRHSKLVG